MIKRIILIIIFLTGINHSYSQKITTNAFEKNNKLIVQIILLNNSEKEYTFYKPKLEDFCNGIIVLKTSLNEVINICNYDSQIDHILIKKSNSVVLKKNQSVVLNYEIKIPTYRTQLEEIVCQINYRDTEFIMNLKNTLPEMFRQILLSESTKIKKE